MTLFDDGKRRRLELEDGDPSSMCSTPHRSPKRPRLDSFLRSTLPSTVPGSHLSIGHGCFSNELATPPPSADGTKNRTMSLKLKIPEQHPSESEKRQIAVRKAAAKRWEESGKLQRPELGQKEVKAAYNLKLLRHYPDPTRDTGASVSMPTSPTPHDNIVKPVIHKSPRVANLLKSFPALTNPVVRPEVSYYSGTVDFDQQNLQRNQKFTESMEAKKLAWLSFAQPDRPRREVMVESALATDDLKKEHMGLPNQLPAWKKFRTSEYAREEKEKLSGKSN